MGVFGQADPLRLKNWGLTPTRAVPGCISYAEIAQTDTICYSSLNPFSCLDLYAPEIVIVNTYLALGWTFLG